MLYVCAQVYDCLPVDTCQRWYIDTLGRIHNVKFPEKCLDVVPGGGNLGRIENCSGVATQRFFNLGEWADATAGCYSLRHKHVVSACRPQCMLLWYVCSRLLPFGVSCEQPSFQ